jgi:sulfide dehydrogenase [flavocytochrome c] flavoprotein subunit
MRLGRRAVIGAGATALMVRPASAAVPRLVIVGGGVAGLSAAWYLRRWLPEAEIAVVEPEPAYVTCFFSNLVLPGWKSLADLTFDRLHLDRAGIRLIPARAETVDGERRTVVLGGGERLPFDRAIVAPGIALRFDAIEGYSEKAAETIPHAWKAGPQTELLARQVAALPDGGTVTIVAPANPYRCPPAPYERASLVAAALGQAGKKGRVTIVDAKTTFPKQALFEDSWRTLYPGMVEWLPWDLVGAVLRVDPSTLTVETEETTIRADVLNVIPPQRAGDIAAASALADESGWCPVDPASGFESQLVPGVHVLGDAAIAGEMPKSAFAADSQAKYCAAWIAAALSGRAAPEARLRNTCYSWLAQDHAVRVGAEYRLGDGVLKAVDSYISALGETAAERAGTARQSEAWYTSLTRQLVAGPVG